MSTEDEAVDQGVPPTTCKTWMVTIKDQKVRFCAGFQPAMGFAQRAGPTGDGAHPQIRPAMSGASLRETTPLAKSPSVVKPAELFDHLQTDVTIRSDPEHPRMGLEPRKIKKPIAEVAFGRRTQSRDRATSADPRSLLRRHVGRVDQTPTCIYVCEIKEMLDRPATRRAHAGLDLSDLLGDVHVHRPCGRSGQRLSDPVRGHGSKAVERKSGSDAASLQRATNVGNVYGPRLETLLLRLKRCAVEASGQIDARSEDKIQPRDCRPFSNRQRAGGLVLVPPALRCPVDVVELSDRTVPALQHFHIGLSCDGLKIIRIQARQKGVHPLAPAPEIVPPAVREFRKSGHGALERMTVHIGRRWQARAVEAFGV